MSATRREAGLLDESARRMRGDGPVVSTTPIRETQDAFDAEVAARRERNREAQDRAFLRWWNSGSLF